MLESLFNLSGLQLKKTLQLRRFPVKLGKFLRTPIFTEHLWLLLLYLMPEAYSKPCQTSQMVKQIENRGIVRTVHSGIFSHIYGHSAIASHIQ